jgi:hypothetical protein
VGYFAFSGPDNRSGNLVFLEKDKCMVREWLSVIPRGAKAAIIATAALLAFMLLWRAVAIIVSDAVSYASRH